MSEMIFDAANFQTPSPCLPFLTCLFFFIWVLAGGPG